MLALADGGTAGVALEPPAARLVATNGTASIGTPGTVRNSSRR
jgi:hypothetical protein